MEQLSFDISMTEERKAFELLYPHILDLIDNIPMDSGIIVFQETNDLSSIYFLNSSTVFFQVRLRKKTRYMLIREEYEKIVPAGTVITKTKTNEGMIRIAMKTPEDILRYIPVLRAVLTDTIRKYRTFDCCSRYAACSDAKKCIHPDAKFALGCQYKKNLMSGKIFYGPNRNID